MFKVEEVKGVKRINISSDELPKGFHVYIVPDSDSYSEGVRLILARTGFGFLEDIGGFETNTPEELIILAESTAIEEIPRVMKEKVCPNDCEEDCPKEFCKKTCTVDKNICCLENTGSKAGNKDPKAALRETYDRTLSNCLFYKEAGKMQSLLNEIGVLRGVAYSLEAVGINMEKTEGFASFMEMISIQQEMKKADTLQA